MNKEDYTHFITDPANPARAIIFAAYKCLECGGIHRKKDTMESVTPWGVAVFNGLIKLELKEIPLVGCSNKGCSGIRPMV